MTSANTCSSPKASLLAGSSRARRSETNSFPSRSARLATRCCSHRFARPWAAITGRSPERRRPSLPACRCSRTFSRCGGAEGSPFAFAAACALYLPFAYYAALALADFAATALMLVGLVLTSRARTIKGSLVAGAVLGFLGLTRPQFLVFPLAAALAVVLTRDGARRRDRIAPPPGS